MKHVTYRKAPRKTAIERGNPNTTDSNTFAREIHIPTERIDEKVKEAAKCLVYSALAFAFVWGMCYLA